MKRVAKAPSPCMGDGRISNGRSTEGSEAASGGMLHLTRMTSRLLALAAILAAAPLGAQQPATPTPAAPATTPAADRAEVLGVVKRLFDAMRAGDSSAARAVFHPQAQLSSALIGRDGTPQVRIDSLPSFLK